jgi:Na+/H+ antiporter NhaD/arsenite permease-like protein
MEHTASIQTDFPHMILGLDPFWTAAFLFVGSYIVIMTEKVNRAIVALLGAGLLIITGLLSQEEAIRAVDFNTLGLLAGMMVIVHITSKTGVFGYIATLAAQKSKARPWPMLMMFALVTALLSGLLDNVTTVLLITPVVIAVTAELGIAVYPYLFTTIFASNIGGTATLIGDPPNIMIGSAVGLTFNDFLYHLAPVCVVIMAAVMVPIYFIWGRKLQASDEARQKVLALNAKGQITDAPLLRYCLFVLALVIGGFILAHPLHLEPATIAMTGAALLLLLENLLHERDNHHKNVHAAFAEAEWVTIFFFVGLFILVAGVEKVGMLNMLSDFILNLSEGDMAKTSMAILWISAIVSAFMDNIPFTATMIPVIKGMAGAFGGAENLMPLWWSLALGACLGGNGTIIGASANLVVAGFSERTGQPIRFVPFLLIAFPIMIMTILISMAYIYLRYL